MVHWPSLRWPGIQLLPVIFAAALVYKTRISRSRESEDYSDSSCGGKDNGARPDHHRNNSSTRSGGALVCRAHRFYHPARVEYLPRPVIQGGVKVDACNYNFARLKRRSFRI